MNKKIEERAEIYRKEMSLLDEGQTKFDDVDLGSARYVAFKAGIEWILEQLFIIKCPSKSMPENEEGKEIEKDSNILATTMGRYNDDGTECSCDLFMKSAKQERWINLYKNLKGDLYIGGNLCKSESEARKVDKDNEFYLHYKTVKIEWEE